MKIEDNFIDQEKFDGLQALMMDVNFVWHYTDTIDYRGQKYKFNFVHQFYNNYVPISSFIEKLGPIIKILTPISLFRIKANLLTKTPNIVENAFHVDMPPMPEEKQKQWTTSIFYVNTNNGYTEFEDGAKVESVANRLVTFSSNMKHRGTSCTDEKRRVVINFNYFSDREP